MDKKRNVKVNYNFIDITNQRFGKLVAIEYVGNRGWLCRCDCGNTKIATGSNLRKGATKSCGCLHKVTARQNGMANALPDGESSFNGLYYGYIKRAKKKNIIFSLDRDSFRELTKQNCYYCGIEPQQAINVRGLNRGGTAYIYNGIDRVDNEKGYEIGNVVSCCKECNNKKHHITIDMCRKIIVFVERD